MPTRRLYNCNGSPVPPDSVIAASAVGRLLVAWPTETTQTERGGVSDHTENLTSVCTTSLESTSPTCVQSGVAVGVGVRSVDVCSSPAPRPVVHVETLNNYTLSAHMSLTRKTPMQNAYVIVMSTDMATKPRCCGWSQYGCDLK